MRREKGGERRSVAKVFAGGDKAWKGEVTFRMTADRRICVNVREKTPSMVSQRVCVSTPPVCKCVFYIRAPALEGITRAQMRGNLCTMSYFSGQIKGNNTHTHTTTSVALNLSRPRSPFPTVR